MDKLRYFNVLEICANFFITDCELNICIVFVWHISPSSKYPIRL